MTLDLSFEEVGDYLLVRVTGDWTRQGIVDGIRDIAERAQMTGQTRILADIRRLSAPKREFDRFLAGEALANAFPRPFKTAVVELAEVINKFAETVAVNRSANFAVFSDMDEAIRWITQDLA